MLHTEREIKNKYSNLRNRANRKGLECTLSRADIDFLLSFDTCALTGVKFEEGHESPFHRTFDRLDGRKGYVLGNVIPVTYVANMTKNCYIERCMGRVVDTRLDNEELVKETYFKLTSRLFTLLEWKGKYSSSAARAFKTKYCTPKPRKTIVDKGLTMQQALQQALEVKPVAFSLQLPEPKGNRPHLWGKYKNWARVVKSC